MPAFNLGYLLRAANTGLASARQGTRERQEMERQREVEDANRLFNEWAKRNQMEFQNRSFSENQTLRRDLEAERTERATAVQTMRDAIAKAAEEGRNDRFRNSGGAVVQDAQGNFQILPRNLMGAPTRDPKVQAPLPESRDGIIPPKSAGGNRFTVAQQMRIAGELSDLADIVNKAKSAGAGITKVGNATGFIRGRIGPALEAAHLVPQDQVAAVSNMENVGSAIRLARSGTAVSKYELQNLGFIPDKNMPEQGIQTRLGELAQNAERLLQTKLELYEGAGLDVSGIRAKLASMNIPQGDDPDEALANRFLLLQRGRKP